MNLSKIRQRLKREHDQIQCDRRDWYTYQQAALYLLDIAKDAVDTFKPYKTPAHRTRDFLQIFYGIKNTAVGILLFAFALLWGVPFCVFRALKSLIYLAIPRIFKDREGISLQLMLDLVYMFLGTAAQTFRGITQIMTSPLTLMRIPLRDHLSIGIKPQYFEDRKSIKCLVQNAEKIIEENKVNSVDEMILVLDEIHRKRHNNFWNRSQSSYPDQHKKDYYKRPKERSTRSEHHSTFIFDPHEQRTNNNQLSPAEILIIKKELEYLRAPVPVKKV